RSLVQQFALMRFAGAGEISEAGDSGHGKALHTEEGGFVFVRKTQQVGHAGNHARHPEINAAVSLKADGIGHAARIVRQDGGESFRSSAHKATDGSACVASPKQGGHAEKGSSGCVINDGVDGGIDDFGHLVGGPLGGLLKNWHTISPGFAKTACSLRYRDGSKMGL